MYVGVEVVAQAEVLAAKWFVPWIGLLCMAGIFAGLSCPGPTLIESTAGMELPESGSCWYLVAQNTIQYGFRFLEHSLLTGKSGHDDLPDFITVFNGLAVGLLGSWQK